MREKEHRSQDEILKEHKLSIDEMAKKRREFENELLKEKNEKEKHLKEDIQRIHDENKSDWIRALTSAQEVCRKAFKGEREMPTSDLVVIAGQMVVVTTNRRMAQRTVQAQKAMQKNRSPLIRPPTL